MNQRRRFKQKRRGASSQRLRDQMAAKHLGREDRAEIARFARYLRGEMTAAERADYEAGR